MGQDAEERLLAAMQGDRRALLDHADAVEQVGTSMQRISRRIRRRLVEGSTEMWTGPGADVARAAFSSLADETETRGRTYQQAAAPMREAARAIKQSRDDYETLPNPWGVRANAGLIGDGGFQDADQMNAWVAEQREALSELRRQESARHYRSYSTSMATAADDLESTLPRRSGEAPPVDTSVSDHGPSGYAAPTGAGGPGSVGGSGGGGGGGGGGGIVRGPGRGDGFGGLGGDGVDPVGTDPHRPDDTGRPVVWPDDTGTDVGTDTGTDPGSRDERPDGAGDGGRGSDDGSGRGGLSAGLGIGAGVAAVGAVGLGIGLSRGRSGAGSPGGLLASAAGARGDGRGAGGRGAGGRGAGGGAGAGGAAGSGSGGRPGRGGMVPVTGMAGAAPNRGGGRGAGGQGARGPGGRGARGVPVTGAAGGSERDDSSPDQHWAVEDDWFGDDESGPPVLR